MRLWVRTWVGVEGYVQRPDALVPQDECWEKTSMATNVGILCPLFQGSDHDFHVESHILAQHTSASVAQCAHQAKVVALVDG